MFKLNQKPRVSINLMMFSLAVGLSFTLAPQKVSAWGGRGHHSICAAAVHLVQSDELRDFLKMRPHILGHLCNVPDIYWKSLAPELRRLGDSTHYINPEKLGLKVSEIPTDFKKIASDYTGKPNRHDSAKTLFSVSDELGTVWWRADQFYRLSLEAARQAKAANPPQDGKEEQNNELPYNQAVYRMLTYMGLMGHFVGDAAQPFHNTTDFDGFAAGHGGIHSYYEEAVIAAFGADLEAQIVKLAKSWKAQKFIASNEVLDNMQALSEASYADIKEVLKLDRVLAPSSLVIDKGMSIKKPAARKEASENLKNFQKITVKHLARASLLLARLWDRAYKQAGEPKLSPYRSYLYPFTPEFVNPDYLP